MARPDREASAAPLQQTSAAAHSPVMPEFHAGYTDSLRLMHMVATLRSLVGDRGTAALLQRSQALCAYPASSETQLNMLYHLSSDLLGEALTQRMFQTPMGQHTVFRMV